MKTISIGDIHGRNVWQQIDPTEYDKIIFVGDYVDAFPPTTNEQIFNNLLNIIEFKKRNKDKVVLLWGNHDLQYIQRSDICSGYRPSMQISLAHLFDDNKKLFQRAFQIKNYIWTHAGVSKEWLEKDFAMALSNLKVNGIDFAEQDLPLADIIGFVEQTSMCSVLNQISYTRGGWNKFGGPLWADKMEFDSNVPDEYHQIVGHSKVENVYGNKYNLKTENESITFIDCLDTVTEFYEKEI